MLSLPDQYRFYFKAGKQESETEQRTLNIMKERREPASPKLHTNLLAFRHSS